MRTLPTTIKGVSTELLAKHPQLRDRIAKAVELILREGIAFHAHTQSGEPVYTARSTSDPKRLYTVMAGSCTCPARTLCYHRVARGILVIRNANQTEVDFGDALSREEIGGEGTTPTAPKCVRCGNPVSEYGTRHCSVTCLDMGVKPTLTIRESMDALGERLKRCRTLLTARPV